MIQRLTTHIPAWMRPDHPTLRYTLGSHTSQTQREKYSRALGFILLFGVLLLIGYAAASGLFVEDPFDLPFSQMLSSILFWPTWMLQIMLQVVVIFMTISTIGAEKRRQTWESLKTTSSGAELTLRSRWTAIIFYRLRIFLVVLILVRVMLIAGILLDLTAFRGEYLNYLTGSITPDVSLPVAVFLLSLMLTASLLLPITGLGFIAALGLLISTAVQQRIYVTLTQITLSVLCVVFIGYLVWAMLQFEYNTLGASDGITWLLLTGFAAFADWGVSFLHLGFYGAEVWADVPYGIFIGLALMIFVLIQAALTDIILAFAIRRAERSER